MASKSPDRVIRRMGATVADNNAEAFANLLSEARDCIARCHTELRQSKGSLDVQVECLQMIERLRWVLLSLKL